LCAPAVARLKRGKRVRRAVGTAAAVPGRRAPRAGLLYYYDNIKKTAWRGMVS